MQVFKLMEPHCRYTMNIGAAARMQFLAPTTVIEGSFTTGSAHWLFMSPSRGMQCIVGLRQARSWLDAHCALHSGMYTWTLTGDVYGALWTFEGQNFEKSLHSRCSWPAGSNHMTSYDTLCKFNTPRLGGYHSALL
jgi:hypothetical protein